MTNNDVLRRLRYALDLSNPTVIEAFRLSGRDVAPSELCSLLKKEGEEGYLECSAFILEDFLDGLIALKRGTRGGAPRLPPEGGGHLSNNDILKKIRIVLALKESQMLAVFRLAGFSTSKSELTALFRTKGHENFKLCGDQLLRNFLKGLTLTYRDGRPAKQ